MSSTYIPWLMALALGAALGCNPSQTARHSHAGHEHGHGHGDAASGEVEDHGHEHTPQTGQITVRSERYEVFAEYEPPVVEKPAAFITHVTDLATHQPKAEGPIKFLMQLGNAPVLEHVQAGPSRPGIYLPRLAFPNPGKWSVKIDIDGALMDLGTVEVFQNAHGAAHASLPQSPEGVHFTKEQQWRSGTWVQPAQQQVVIATIIVPGTVVARPGSMATVVAPVTGRLKIENTRDLPLPGQRVEKGQLLALLQPTFSEQATRLLEAEANRVRAAAQFEQARLALERTRRLADEQAKSPREVQEAEFNFKTAEANYHAAVALSSTYSRLTGAPGSTDSKLDFSSLGIRAPISGLISTMPPAAGELIQQDQVLFTILNNEEVWVETRIPESKLNTISRKPQAFLRDKEGHVDLTFVYAGVQVDASSRSFPMAFSTTNTNGQLKIGQRVTLELESRRSEQHLAVPESSIVEEHGNPTAYVQLAGETFEKRELVLGVRGRGQVQVIQGLHPGDLVVTRGAYAIRLASVSPAVPSHGHAH